jgi:hypothetical protein
LFEDRYVMIGKQIVVQGESYADQGPANDNCQPKSGMRSWHCVLVELRIHDDTIIGSQEGGKRSKLKPKPTKHRARTRRFQALTYSEVLQPVTLLTKRRTWNLLGRARGLVGFGSCPVACPLPDGPFYDCGSVKVLTLKSTQRHPCSAALLRSSIPSWCP